MENLGDRLLRVLGPAIGFLCVAQICICRVEAELSWRPRVTLEEGLASSVEWYTSDADQVDRLRSGAYHAREMS